MRALGARAGPGGRVSGGGSFSGLSGLFFAISGAVLWGSVSGPGVPFLGLSGPFRAFQGPSGPFRAPQGPFRAFLGLFGPFWAFFLSIFAPVLVVLSSGPGGALRGPEIVAQRFAVHF